MADSYVPIFYDWTQVTEELNAQEKGRLIDAIVCYARGDEDWQEQIKGNERYLFPAFKRQIDRANELSKIRSEAASKPKQTEAKASKSKQTEAKASKSDKEEEYKKEYKEEYEYENNNTGSSNAAAPTFDSPAVYASSNLQHMSPHAFEELATFQEDLPDDVIIHGIDAACDQGVRTWAYVRSILNRYVSAGYKSIGDVKAAEQKRKQGSTANSGQIPEYRDFDWDSNPL